MKLKLLLNGLMIVAFAFALNGCTNPEGSGDQEQEQEQTDQQDDGSGY